MSLTLSSLLHVLQRGLSEKEKEVCGDLLKEVYGVTRLSSKPLFLLPVPIFCKRGFRIIPQGRTASSRFPGATI